MSRFPREALRGVGPERLAWIAGSWVGLNGQDPVEEHWAPLRGNALMGMFRWVTRGVVKFYELIVIEQEGESVFLRIKHFHPKLVGWEERDRAHELVLVQAEGQEAVFLELNASSPRWAIYRLETPNRLVSYFASEEEAVTDTGMFTYSRTVP